MILGGYTVEYLKSEKGVALLIVMAILAVTTLVVALLFNIKIADIKMNNDYEDYNRAMYISEAGADLVINEWIEFINDQDTLANSIDIDNSGFVEQVELKSKALVGDFIESYHQGQEMVDIKYRFFVDGSESNRLVYELHNNSESLELDVEITGIYNDVGYVSYVNLQYCNHGRIIAHKGRKHLSDDRD